MRRFDAVIFDMDGTLIEPMLDFAAIRRELGIGESSGVLETIEQMPPFERAAAERLLMDRELAAARKAVVVSGAVEIVRRCRNSAVKTALLTRNCRQAMEIVLEIFLGQYAAGPADVSEAFDLVRSRQDGPIKPSPDGVLLACRELGTEPERTCCVGDHVYDVTAANAAGATSVLLTRGQHRPYADQADCVIIQLTELAEILGI